MTNQYLEETLKTKREAGQNIFIPYIMAGDGGLDNLEKRIHLLETSGASAIELGIPFSDPVADGPVIQDAGKRALDMGVTLTDILATLRAFNKSPGVPIILMTYLNPIYIYGIEAFGRDCQESGISGVIIPDLPLEEESIVNSFHEHDIALIRLAALTSPQERLREIARRTEGFLYAVSVTGTTGARKEHGQDVKTYLETLKGYTSVPVLAGFGVSSAEQATDLSHFSDGVVVGSKIVDLFERGEHEQINTLIQESIR